MSVFDDIPKEYPLDRIASTLEELLRVYKAHVRLTARSARLALEPNIGDLPPDIARNILEILAELDEVTA